MSMTSPSEERIERSIRARDFLMIISHFTALMLFSLLVSAAFAVLGVGSLMERVIYGVKAFVAFVGIAIILGWLMYPFPR
jgi:hypothetical protein